MPLTRDQHLYSDIAANAADAIMYADRDGIIRLWNRGAQRIFGFSTEEALGQSLDIIIPPKLRERHWQGYATCIKTGNTRYGDKLLSVPALTKSSEQCSSEFSIVLLIDSQGKPSGVAAILRDVTERWEKDQQLRRRLRELEQALNK